MAALASPKTTGKKALWACWFPVDDLAELRGVARRDGVTMTSIVARGVRCELDRLRERELVLRRNGGER